MSTPDELFERSEQAKAEADGCQIHTPGYAANMAAAQLYATQAVFLELRQQRHQPE